jgi:L-iditol 2-dehydrogenase
MKAAVTRSFGSTRVEEVPRPEAGRGEAVILVDACGVCSGEGLPWYVNRKVPTVLGHEIVGTITEIGDGVDGLRVGDRVFAHHHVPCGECHYCRRGNVSSCALFKETALDPGGYAEYVRIPRQNLERDTVPIPREIPLEEAVFLEPIACSVRAFRRLRFRRGESILVIGLGVMGIVNLLLARRYGASRLVASDFIPERREIALRHGADVVVDPARDDALTRIREATEGRGPDAVIVGPGTAEAVTAGLDAVSPGGVVLMYTPIPEGDAIPLKGYGFYFNEQTLTTSYSAGPEDTQEALAIVAERELPLADLVTGRFDLDGVDEAMLLLRKGGGHLKSVIYPGGVGGAEA